MTEASLVSPEENETPVPGLYQVDGRRPSRIRKLTRTNINETGTRHGGKTRSLYVSLDGVVLDIGRYGTVGYLGEL